MKKPSSLSKIKLEYCLPFQEFGIEPDTEKNREMGKQLKKFYFGYSPFNADTISVYLMVRRGQEMT